MPKRGAIGTPMSIEQRGGKRRAAPIPYTEASEVRITQPDGTVVVRAAYTKQEFHEIVRATKKTRSSVRRTVQGPAGRSPR